MIINTGSRTDIPAYYSEWFYNRIREGSVMVRNPMYPDQITRYRLSPDVVDLLVFCTKNPEPMLGRLDELSAYRQFWYVTITPYGRDIEPGVPDKDQVIESFKRLSDQNGVSRTVWRYDPIFISDRYPLEFHMEQFDRMARILKGYTDQCVISFIDLYEKTKRNFPGVREVTGSEQLLIGEAFAGIGVSLEVPEGRKAAREGCDCLLGNDIGVYNTCVHGCIYCYANYSGEAVRENRSAHIPQSPLLVGSPGPEDHIRDAKQASWTDGQMKLFSE